ncbi:MAG: sulfatase [Acidobacteria bacterium]|nr:sulfatase [Acidobacteriota bacterium]
MRRAWLALPAGVLSGLILAMWNVVHVALAARLYRHDISRTAELFGLALLFYIPAAIALVSGAGIARRFAMKRSNAESDLAFHAGAAVTVTAFLFALGVIALRDPLAAGAPGSPAPDLLLAALMAIAAGLGASRLDPARIPGAAVGLLAGTPAALITWEISRDSLSGAVGAIVAVALAVLAGGSTAAAAVWIGKGAIAWARRRAVALALAAGAGALGALAMWTVHEATAAPTATGPNVLLIVADTLRADHVGCYGARTAKTPNIDGLAARGARVDPFYAASAWTAPATASLLTGLYPSGHGLLTYRDQIGERVESVASLFESAGYATAGFSANPILSARYGFGAGFETWDEDLEPDPLARHRPSPLYATLDLLGMYRAADRFPTAAAVVTRALAWLDERRQAPFFLYLHLMDAHDPYIPPASFVPELPGAAGSTLEMRIGTLPAIMDGKRRISAADFERMQALYAGAAGYVDAQAGRLFDEMTKRGLLERTLVVFTADHGEEFLDHGDLEHTRSLFEEITRIPLVVAGPGVAAGSLLAGPIRQVDVAPTLAEAAGLMFAGRTDGVSIWSALRGNPIGAARDAFMELSYPGYRSPWHTQVALRRGGLKLVASSFNPGREGPWTFSLFDLAADPHERLDSSRRHEAETAAMREALEAWSRRPTPFHGRGGAYDDETERRLRALGYID